MVLVAATVASSLLTLSGIARAGGTPGQVCAGAKLKATAKSAGLSLGCHATAARRGVAVDATCLAKAGAKLADAFAGAEARGGCVTTSDAGDVAAIVDSAVGAFVTALRPNPAASRCASVKLKATGKKATTKLGCHAKALRRGLAIDPGCLAKAEARFAAAFATAEGHPLCLTTGDASTVEALVDDLVDDVVAALAPGVTTTTTTSTTTTTTGLVPACGNGIVESGEYCDGTGCDTLEDGCVPPGDPNECTCCSTQACQYGLGCCPGFSCVPNGGPGGLGFCTTATCGGLETVCSPGGLSCCPGFLCLPPPGFPGYPYDFCCALPGGTCTQNAHCCTGVCAAGICQ
jgi:hypothetical protein